MTTGSTHVATLTQERTTSYTAKLYCDVKALLDGGLAEPPAPVYAVRSDNVGLFYKRNTNSLVGDPESGKTWIMLAAAAEVLFLKGKVLLLDLDHNGPSSIVSRLKAFGISDAVLSDPEKFRFAEPEDQYAVSDIIDDAKVWEPDFVGIDSVGELLPIYGASSNSPDDFTRVNSAAIKPFAAIGAAVVVIDHLAKNSDSRNYGASGTAAKKRAISGVSLRVSCTDAFTPGSGGKAELTIIKDRHGGLRAKCPSGDKEPLAAKFVLTQRNDALNWHFYAPEPGEQSTADRVPEADVNAIAKLNPPPKSVADARERLQWNTERAGRALKEWRASGSVSAFPGSDEKQGNVLDFPGRS